MKGQRKASKLGGDLLFQATSGSSCEGPVIRFVPEKPSLGPGVRGMVTLMTVSVCIQISAMGVGISEGPGFFPGATWDFQAWEDGKHQPSGTLRGSLEAGEEQESLEPIHVMGRM